MEGTNPLTTRREDVVIAENSPMGKAREGYFLGGASWKKGNDPI